MLNRVTAVESVLANPIEPDYWLRTQSAIEADLAELRSDAPVTYFAEPEVPEDFPLPQGPGYWCLVRHADIVHVSKNADLFSSAAGITVNDIPPEFNEFFGSMIVMDDPRHARLRRLVAMGFTPKMLKRLEETVQLVASDIVDSICERGEVDFVVDVAAALPLKIVCDLMGIPPSQYDFVFDQTNVILGASDPEYVAEESDILTALLEAGGALAAVMKDVAESKAGSDGDDLTSLLVNAELDGDRLGPDDLASFFILLVVAGNETTRNAIGWGLRYLTDHPEERSAWADDFQTLAPGAIEEIVRLASPVTYMRRTATSDTEIRGQAIAEGDKLCMFYFAANRDEAVFDDPYRFDIRRSPNSQIGFGGPGPHYCLGAHLARREITVMYRELFDRLPDIVATGEAEALRSSFIHGVKHMTAQFTPVGRS